MSNFVPPPSEYEDDGSGTPARGDAHALDRTELPEGKRASASSPVPDGSGADNYRDYLSETFLHVIREQTFRAHPHPRIDHNHVVQAALLKGLPGIDANPAVPDDLAAVDHLVDIATNLAGEIDTADPTLPTHWISLQDMFYRNNDEIMSWLREVDRLPEKLNRAYLCTTVCKLGSRTSSELLNAWKSLRPLSPSGVRVNNLRARTKLAAAGVPVEELKRFLQNNEEPEDGMH
jgi:hypothetical protein